MRLGYALSAPGAAPGGARGAPGLDAILAALARALTAEGRRVTGAVQRTERDAQGRLSLMELQLLPEMAPVDIAQRLGAGASGCRLDPGALEQATLEIARRLDGGADLLIVPRFGKREAEGGGYRAAIAAAVEAGIPVLVGVSPAWLGAFEDFAGGAAEAVAPVPEALRSWALGAGPRGAPQP